MFTIRSYSSEEKMDLGKFMDFKIDTYDVLNSPFLDKLKTLPTVSYYKVSDGYKDIDRISYTAYGTPMYSFYILYYNNLQDERLDEETVLNLFSIDDLNSLYYDLANGMA